MATTKINDTPEVFTFLQPNGTDPGVIPALGTFLDKVDSLKWGKASDKGEVHLP